MWIPTLKLFGDLSLVWALGHGFASDQSFWISFKFFRQGVNFNNILCAHCFAQLFSSYILALAKVRKHFCTKNTHVKFWWNWPQHGSGFDASTSCNRHGTFYQVIFYVFCPWTFQKIAEIQIELFPFIFSDTEKLKELALFKIDGLETINHF